MEVAPGFKRSPFGNQRYWTEERVLAALQVYVAASTGPLPCRDALWSAVKKGRSDLPVSRRVLEYYGSMADAWAAAGAAPGRISRRNIDWTAAEEDYLLEYAGTKTLAMIGRKLGRSAGACKRRLAELGTTARAASGYLSMQAVASEYGCPLSRVKRLISDGTLPAGRLPGIPAWRIDPDAAAAVRAQLTAPKGTYKRLAPDVGNYEARYGLKRVLGEDGRVVRVAKRA